MIAQTNLVEIPQQYHTFPFSISGKPCHTLVWQKQNSAGFFSVLQIIVARSQMLHGTGIFTYMKTIKINHSWIGKYTRQPWIRNGDVFNHHVMHFKRCVPPPTSCRPWKVNPVAIELGVFHRLSHETSHTKLFGAHQKSTKSGKLLSKPLALCCF